MIPPILGLSKVLDVIGSIFFTFKTNLQSCIICRCPNHLRQMELMKRIIIDLDSFI